MKYCRGKSFEQIDVADDFYEAYIRCLKPDKDHQIVSIPGFTCGLFACEIYLKVILSKQSEGSRSEKQHDLKQLFILLNDDQKEIIRRLNTDPEYNIDFLLDQIGNGFVEWRYIYEDGNENFGDKYPFLYTERFLSSFLPILQKIAKE